jgi:hypothetical protein
VRRAHPVDLGEERGRRIVRRATGREEQENQG